MFYLLNYLINKLRRHVMYVLGYWPSTDGVRSTRRGSARTGCGSWGRRAAGASSGPDRPSCIPWSRRDYMRRWDLRAEKTLTLPESNTVLRSYSLRNSTSPTSCTVQPLATVRSGLETRRRSGFAKAPERFLVYRVKMIKCENRTQTFICESIDCNWLILVIITYPLLTFK